MYIRRTCYLHIGFDRLIIKKRTAKNSCHTTHTKSDLHLINGTPHSCHSTVCCMQFWTGTGQANDMYEHGKKHKYQFGNRDAVPRAVSSISSSRIAYSNRTTMGHERYGGTRVLDCEPHYRNLCAHKSHRAARTWVGRIF